MNNPARSFLLLIGAQGAMLLPPLRAESAAPVAAATHSEADSQVILSEIAAAPDIPVILIDDTNALQFKAEDLPLVSLWDRRKLVARRVEQTFGSHALKTALTQCRHETVLLALDESGPLAQWQKRLEELPNRFGVVASLGVECADLFAALSSGPPDGWGLILLAQQTGGIRQIVTRDGRFVFTRLTQSLPESLSDGFRATTLALDVKATRDYLLRFGLTAGQTMRLVAILPDYMRKAVEVTPMDVGERVILSPHEAAVRLNLTHAPSEETPTSDLVALLWLAARRKLRAPMMSAASREIVRDWALRRATRLIAAFCGLVALGVLIAQGGSLLYAYSAVSAARHQVVLAQGELDAARNTLAPATEPLGRLRKAAERKRLFSTTDKRLDDLLPLVAESLGDKARLTRLDWTGATGSLTISVHAADSAAFEAIHDRLRDHIPKATIDSAAPSATGQLSNTHADKKQAASSEAQFTIRLQKEAAHER